MVFRKRPVFFNLSLVLAVGASLIVFFITPWGKPVLQTILLVPEVVPDFPIKPLKFFSKEPQVKEVTIQTGEKEIKADLYRPQDDKKHPSVVFTIGTIITKRDPVVTKFAQSLSRIGFVVLVPDLPDFLQGFVWTDSVNTLISSVEFLYRQPFVEKEKIGFAGFCVGASASIIAAEDEKISDKIAFIAAVSPYFDLFSLSEAVTSRQAENGKGGFEPWEPAELTIESVQKGFINYIPDEKERELLSAYFLGNKIIAKEKIDSLSPKAAYVYSFLSNSNREKMAELWQKIPEDGRQLLRFLSPSTKIERFKAKLYILNDKKDTYVPRIEGEKLTKSLPKKQVYFIEVDSFEHVNPATKLKRWAALKGLFQLGRYLYNVLSQVS